MGNFNIVEYINKIDDVKRLWTNLELRIQATLTAIENNPSFTMDPNVVIPTIASKNGHLLGSLGYVESILNNNSIEKDVNNIQFVSMLSKPILNYEVVNPTQPGSLPNNGHGQLVGFISNVANKKIYRSSEYGANTIYNGKYDLSSMGTLNNFKIVNGISKYATITVNGVDLNYGDMLIINNTATRYKKDEGTANLIDRIQWASSSQLKVEPRGYIKDYTTNDNGTAYRFKDYYNTNEYDIVIRTLPNNYTTEQSIGSTGSSDSLTIISSKPLYPIGREILTSTNPTFIAYQIRRV